MSDLSQINDQMLDKLVDGELSPKRRQELLSALEQANDGWRQCALAFLESQAWGREFKQLTHEPITPDVKPTRPASNGLLTPSGWLMLAASLLVAFLFGWQLQHGGLSLPGDTAEPSLIIAASSDTSASDPTDMQSGSPAEEQIVAGEIEPRDSNMLTMWVQDKQGHRREIGVPLVEAASLDPQFGTQFQSGISEPLRRQIESRGYRVNTRRRYAPLWMENGQPLVVPVEDTQIVPVSRTVY